MSSVPSSENPHSSLSFCPHFALLNLFDTSTHDLLGHAPSQIFAMDQKNSILDLLVGLYTGRDAIVRLRKPTETNH